MNGYERGAVVAYGNSGGTRQLQAYGGGGSVGACPNNNEPRDRTQPRREGENRSQTDTHSLGESLTSDSGFCDGTRGLQAQSKDVSYWRRRGQDFTVLLDYADFRDPHGVVQGGYHRPEGAQQARGQEPSPEDRQRAAQERQRWAAQAQAQAHAQAQVQAQVQAQARSREREAALHQWRMANERKCQSLGTDEWRPAVSFARQLSQAEGERWAQEQQRLHARTPEGMVVHPRTKAKSQSLPRMLQPESLQYVDITSSGQEPYRRVNGHPLSHHDFYRAPRWPENGRPASATQLSITPKLRFTRPPRPPSYEMHQQIRGSCEVLSGRDSVVSQARDRTPIPMSRPSDHHQLDYFAQESGPPGYIPPPSYKRAPLMPGVRRGYGEIAVEYRYRGDVYPQIHVAPDGSHWFTRHPACPWPDPQRDRSTSSQKQLYPVYTTQERPGGGVQYIPFDDPRIRHFSSALGGNSLTDADKIRHIRNELPSVTVSEPAPDDSAFLPPPLGPFIAAKMADDSNQMSSSDNDNNRWHSDLHKETVDNFPAPDQNCNNRYSKNPRPPPSPSSAFQAPLPRSASRQGSNSDQVFAETITQVKKIAPDSGPDHNRNAKRRVSETIFCLVSVPLHTPTNFSKDLAADQNNNETMSSLTITNTDTFAVGLKESPNIRSKSVNEMPIKTHYSHFYTSSTSSMRNYKRAPLRKEIIDAWALQASEEKELCYAGSWPGNQYRNQETQTGSPLTGVKSPEPQNSPVEQEPVQSASDTTTDSGVGTDNSSSYTYPMVGQKNFNPSSNSAFSRLSLSPTQSSSLQPSPQDPPSPYKRQNSGDQQPSSPQKSPPDSSDQVVFGQFLLKPVNRRPCDAIGELESINKEMEDTISKRPTSNKSIDDLGGRNKRVARLRAGPHVTSPEPGRESISLPPLHTEKPNNLKVRSKSFASPADLESMLVTSTFTRPQADSILHATDPSILVHPASGDSYPLSSVPASNDSNRLYKQDIPVAQESLLRDVGLTVYTETPGGPGEPMQRSLSVPSPLDCKALSQSMQLSWDTRTEVVQNSDSLEHNSNEELDAEVNTERKAKSGTTVPPPSLSICRSRSEGSKSPQKSSSKTKLARELSFMINDDGMGRYAFSEPLTYRNESTEADKHLENLLIQEKANSLPTEDFSNLYEVKYAKGIPENESIEQRAARILGIAVPVGALGVADKEFEGNDDLPAGDQQQSPNEEMQQVTSECEQVEEESLSMQEVDEEVKETESHEIQKEPEECDTLKHSNDHGEGGGDQHTDTQPVLDLPEFPPSKLTLSLPVATDRKKCSGEKKGRGGAGKLIESLQDKLNSSSSSASSSLGRSATGRMARLKELDSVSRIRRLSLKGSDSEREADSKQRGETDTEECEPVDVVEPNKEKEDKEVVKEVTKVKENPEEPENAHRILEKLGDLEEDCQPEEKTKDVCKELQEEEVEKITSEIALKVDNEGSKEAAVEIQEVRKEQPGGEVELKIMKEDRVKVSAKVKDEQNAAVKSRTKAAKGADGAKAPKPKQRTKLQKPPLLPKPRSVPKREITLPVSFNTGTCGPSNKEEEEMLSVSDSYDPSRVERV